jgi:hypothetical protein
LRGLAKLVSATRHGYVRGADVARASFVPRDVNEVLMIGHGGGSP